jgi:hypothetical protein
MAPASAARYNNEILHPEPEGSDAMDSPEESPPMERIAPPESPPSPPLAAQQGPSLFLPNPPPPPTVAPTGLLSPFQPDSVLTPAILPDPPFRARIGILYLMVWTACVAFYMGMFRWAFDVACQRIDLTQTPHIVGLTAIPLLIYISLGSGASLAGLLLWAGYRRSGRTFPYHPGEYLIIIRGISALAQVFAAALTGTLVSLFGDQYEDLPYVYVPAVFLVIIVFLFVEHGLPVWASQRMPEREWESFFLLRAMSVAAAFLVFTGSYPGGQMLLAFALIMLIIQRRGRSVTYPWTHWLGVWLELWWDSLGMLVIITAIVAIVIG